MASKKKETSRIPDFTSRGEEAEWFDTHDMADYQDEFKPVKVQFAKKLSDEIILTVDFDTMASIRDLAKQKGWPVENLVTVWVLERLQQEKAEDARSSAAPTSPARNRRRLDASSAR